MSRFPVMPRAVATALLLLAIAAAAPVPVRAWSQSEFIFATFGDPFLECHYRPGYQRFWNCDSVSRDSLRWVEARDAQFNLLLGLGGAPPSAYEHASPSNRKHRYTHVRNMLLAKSVGFKYLAADDRIRMGTSVFNQQTADAATDFYEDSLEATLSGFGLPTESIRDSTFYGYMIGDEPAKQTVDTTDIVFVRSWMRHIHEEDPDRLGYVNLLPSSAFNYLNSSARARWEEYLDLILDNADPEMNPDVVSFDHYPFVNDSVKTDYFYILNTIRVKAGARPVWAYILATPVDSVYEEPSEEQLRFMAMCPLAYGVKGLGYLNFSIDANATDADGIQNYWLSPEAPAGDGRYHSVLVQPKYEWVRSINKYIVDFAAPVVMSCQHLGAFHKSDEPTGESMSPEWLMSGETPIVADVGSDSLMVGVFRDSTASGSYYILVVNKGLSATTTSVTLRGLHCDVAVSPPMAEYAGDGDYEEIEPTFDGGTVVSLELGGGEGRWIRVPRPDEDMLTAWTESSQNNLPSARWDASVIFDEAGQRFVLFGGDWRTSGGGSHTEYNDLHSFDMATRAWSALSPTGTPPPAGGGYGAAYDPSRNRMLVTNGSSVWACTLTATPAWRQLTTTAGGEGSPSARDNFAAVYDGANDALVLCGGASDASTWMLPLSTLVWDRLDDMPSEYTHHVTGVYHEVDDKLLVFGGVRYSNYECTSGDFDDPVEVATSSDQVLVLDLSSYPPTWSTLNPMPGLAGDIAAAWDSRWNMIRVLGGSTITEHCIYQPACGSIRYVTESPASAVWLCDPEWDMWEELTDVGCATPAARGHAAFAIGTGDHDMGLLFGGGHFVESVQGCGKTGAYTYRDDRWLLDSEIAPAPTPLAMARKMESVRLTWPASGENGFEGRANYYQLKTSTSPITDANFDAATTLAQGSWASLPPGGTRRSYVHNVGACSTPRFYGIRWRDAMSHWSSAATTGPISTHCSTGPDRMHPVAEATRAGAVDAAEMVVAGPAGRIVLHFGIPESWANQPFRLDIFDVAGRRVRTLEKGTARQGRHVIEWDGRTDAGVKASNGMYFVQLRGARGGLARKTFLVN